MTYALKYLQVRMGLQFVAMEEFYSEENVLSMIPSRVGWFLSSDNNHWFKSRFLSMIFKI